MSTNVRPIPEGYHSITPYLAIRDAAKAIEFYKRAFGATERYRMPGPDGNGIAHAELQIGNSIIMVADEMPECGNKSAQTYGGSPVGFAIYTEDCDAAFQRAIKAGATEKQPLADQFWGDRSGTVTDPYGYQWMLLTHVEDLSPEEIQQRGSEFFEKMAAHK